MKNKRGMSDIDCWNEENIICPYCYEEVEDYDYSVARREGVQVEVECPHCGESFYCESEHSVTYTSTRIGENGERISSWEDEEND